MANVSKFSWTDPTTNTDGSALGAGEITGYVVGVRPSSGTAGTYPSTIAAASGATSALVSGLSPALTSGSYFAAVQTQSTTNGNSAWSSEVAFTLTASPNPPSNFSIA